MSDDGFPAGGYDDDYDDFLWDLEPEQDLADDLASHAIHSPNWQEDFTNDLEDYHSDWDYYSDDYYDDDPAILNRNPQDGPPIQRKVREDRDGDNPKRGKKRKLVEVQDIPDPDSGEKTLKDCLKGVVWAKPPPERDNVFVPGIETKIALLRDWKTLFGTTSVQDKGKPDAPPVVEDESWANDMSLADMGLNLARGSIAEDPAKKNEAGSGNDEDGHDGDGEGTELDAETAAEILQRVDGMNDEEAAALLDQLKGQIRVDGGAAGPRKSTTRKPHPLAEVQYRASSPLAGDQTDDPLATLPKRRKYNNEVLPSPPQSNQSLLLEHEDNAAPAPADEEQQDAPQGQPRGRGHPGRGSRAVTSQRGTSSSTVNSTKSRKRKASLSPSPEESKGASRPTASSRAKRVASIVKGVGIETSAKEKGGMNVSTRASRKK